MFREIVCKTLTGKGKINQVIEKELFISNEISKTLGCWIINLKHEIIRENLDIFVKGSYDIQLWYALDNDQKSEVYNETIEFYEKVNMSYRDLKVIDNEIYTKVYVPKYPSCTSMELDENKKIKLKIEALYFVDTFQEALLVVNCSDDYGEDVSIEEEIVMNVNPNYINDVVSTQDGEEHKS